MEFASERGNSYMRKKHNSQVLDIKKYFAEDNHYCFSIWIRAIDQSLSTTINLNNLLNLDKNIKGKAPSMLVRGVELTKT